MGIKCGYRKAWIYHEREQTWQKRYAALKAISARKGRLLAASKANLASSKRALLEARRTIAEYEKAWIGNTGRTSRGDIRALRAL